MKFDMLAVYVKLILINKFYTSGSYSMRSTSQSLKITVVLQETFQHRIIITKMMS